jgi:hypothetical protein
MRFNLFPAYRRTGARILHVSGDLQEVWIKLLRRWNNRNHHGTVWGGSIYGCTDPVYTIMLSLRLKKPVTVWDKKAEIEFKSPVKDTVYAKFELSDQEIHEILDQLETTGKSQREYNVDLIDREGKVYASVKKHIYIMGKH